MTQKKFFKLCTGTHRFFYNKAIEEINKRYNDKKIEFQNKLTCLKCKKIKEPKSFYCAKHKDEKPFWNLSINLPSIRKSVMHKDSELTPDEIWQKDIPYDTRQLAISEAVKAYNSAVASHKTFELKFKERSTAQSFWVDSSALRVKNKKWHIFVQRLKTESKLYFDKENIRFLKKRKCMHDTQIINDRGTWYMLYTYPRDYEKITKPTYTTISLDPGVRTFNTGYSPEGVLTKFGEKQIEQIHKIHSKLDETRNAYRKINKNYNFRSKSEISQEEKVKRCKRNLKKKEWRLSKKVYDVVSNLHNQVNAHLTNTYDHIIVPTFNTHQMIQSRQLASSTKRMMNSLQFYRFRMKLQEQCKRKNRHFHLVSEAYTTMTCGSCGFLKRDVGSAKTYRCDRMLTHSNQCTYTKDRDVHGARNILIRYLTKLESFA